MFAAFVSSVLLGALPLQQAPESRPSTPDASERSRIARQATSVVDTVGPEDDGGMGFASYATATVGGSMTLGVPRTNGGGVGTPGSLTPIQVRQSMRLPQMLEISISGFDTGTGFPETALLYVPSGMENRTRPLLLAFHGFGRTEYDVLESTEYLRQARARDWFLLMPLGAATKNYGSVECQQNIEVLLDVVMQLISVDPQRIYGLGFSMGGGGIATFAARHLDPARPMIAAVVNHTGNVSLLHTYDAEPDDDDSIVNDPPLEAPDVLDFWHGGAPSFNPFGFSRTSVIDLEPISLLVDPTTDMARNLTHVPFYSFYVENDSLGYPIVQLFALHNWLQSLGGSSILATKPGTFHDWSTLDEADACNFLAQHTLSLPAAGSRVLADRDERWFYFDVTQDAPGSFTPFTWAVDGFANSITISDSANLATIGFDPVEVGLDPFTPMSMDVSTADGTGDEIRIGPIPNPSQVLRDGFPDLSWSHDPGTQTLTLLEFDGFLHSWQILP